MKAVQLSERLVNIDDDLIEQAVNVGTSGKNKHHKKRIGIAVLVAAIVIVASLSTAMAVNTDFRAAVIAFFKLSTPEIVVEDNQVTATGDITIISSADVDGLVDINYLKIDDNYEYNDGVVFTYRGDADYANGIYYRVINNELVPLPTKRVETSFSCRSYTWSVRFDYAVIDGKLYIHNIPDSRMPETEQSDAIFAYASAMKNGSTQKLLLTLPFPHANLRSYSEYAVELDIGTGEITDFLSQCGFDSLAYLINDISFSDDLSKAVVTCYSEDYNGYAATYYCNIADHKLVPIGEITGKEPADNYQLLDNETLFFTTDNSNGWRLNLKTGEMVSVYTGLSAYTDSDGGVQFLGGKYALLINADRKAWLMDLMAGTRSLIDGFTFTTLTGSYINADQTKIYFHCYNEDNLEIGNIGVLNIAEGKMLLMDREGQQIRKEWNVGWFDNSRIAVNAYNDSGNHYLYLYEFKN